MSNNVSDVERAEMMLAMNMNESGGPLSDSERASLEEFVAGQEAQGAPQPAEPSPGAQAEQDLSALVQAEIAKALGGGLGLQPTSFEDVLKQVDPRDSDAALAMFNWLSENGRFQLVGTLNGGGYLLHYSEPKGSSKQGYTPGATQGGRMVDQAVEKAKASGAKPRVTGLCPKCMSAVENDNGTIVSDDEHKNAACPAGGAHEFVG